MKKRRARRRAGAKIRRKPVNKRSRPLARTRQKRLRSAKNNTIVFDSRYHAGFDAGFAKGFEDGHKTAYEQSI